ncbi:MAG: redoxin domain-containing protein [Holosporales bacterium]|nr:redoxin domain-containing protein [Holosporales bacterium]
MSFRTAFKIYVCAFIPTLCAQQIAPVYPANAGQGTLQQTAGVEQGGIGQQQQARINIVEAFVKTGDTFAKQAIQLKRAIVIFYAINCPYCDNLFAALANHIESLKKAGIDVVFVNVPAPDRLQAGQPPTADEYKQAVEKVTARNISLDGSKTFVVALADASTLSKLSITGLPVMFAMIDSVEKARKVGQEATQTFNNADEVKRFIALFGSVTEEDTKSEKAKSGKPADHKRGRKGSETLGTAQRGINRSLAEEYTDMLNSMGLNCPASLGNTQRSAQPASNVAVPASNRRGCMCSCK